MELHTAMQQALREVPFKLFYIEGLPEPMQLSMRSYCNSKNSATSKDLAPLATSIKKLKCGSLSTESRGNTNKKENWRRNSRPWGSCTDYKEATVSLAIAFSLQTPTGTPSVPTDMLLWNEHPLRTLQSFSPSCSRTIGKANFCRFCPVKNHTMAQFSGDTVKNVLKIDQHARSEYTDTLETPLMYFLKWILRTLPAEKQKFHLEHATSNHCQQIPLSAWHMNQPKSWLVSTSSTISLTKS